MADNQKSNKSEKIIEGDYVIYKYPCKVRYYSKKLGDYVYKEQIITRKYKKSNNKRGRKPGVSVKKKKTGPKPETILKNKIRKKIKTLRLKELKNILALIEEHLNQEEEGIDIEEEDEKKTTEKDE